MSEDETIDLKEVCKTIQENLTSCHKFLMHLHMTTDIELLKAEVKDAFESLRLLERNFNRIQQVLK